ncbi:Phenylalanyl-tRNA synthetase [Operophtera brumata]|uniref:phenylalanine--tRNA ligase n=1 Tax=Operophtera brumata TaxID=104452 RepID=A0A0L7L0D6_OPEBR|nr:Phenylalanyl-tRNA synthetase [Operophtera brumata]
MTKLFLGRSRLLSAVLPRCSYSTAPKSESTVRINDKEFNADDFTNITPKISSYLGQNLHLQKHNPLSLVRQRIVNYFYSSFTHGGNPSFSVYDNLSPIVTTRQNFDELLIPADHPSRAKSDCYYVNRGTLLRAHMTAHQSELLKSGLDNFLMIGDVYRRDEIDSTHFPVFHQPSFDPEHPHKFTNSISDAMKQSCHTLEATKLMEAQLKNHLIGLVQTLFGENIEHRWVEEYFPFTHPSWELEILYEGKWMEVLGCGIVRNEILANAGPNHSIAYAFGLGLERLAMALYKIPDIRLMWSKDSGFLSQFQTNDINTKITYKPVSSYPQCVNDISFWLPGNESSKKHSLCYSIVYRHLERTLTQAEVNRVHKEIEQAAVNAFNIVIR